MYEVIGEVMRLGVLLVEVSMELYKLWQGILLGIGGELGVL